MGYDQLDLKIPYESPEYSAISRDVISRILKELNSALNTGKREIILSTNLKQGIPLGNIHLLAGPMIEAWFGELFQEICQNPGNVMRLKSVRPQ